MRLIICFFPLFVHDARKSSDAACFIHLLLMIMVKYSFIYRRIVALQRTTHTFICKYIRRWWWRWRWGKEESCTEFDSIWRDNTYISSRTFVVRRIDMWIFWIRFMLIYSISRIFSLLSFLFCLLYEERWALSSILDSFWMEFYQIMLWLKLKRLVMWMNEQLNMNMNTAFLASI